MINMKPLQIILLSTLVILAVVTLVPKNGSAIEYDSTYCHLYGTDQYEWCYNSLSAYRADGWDFTHAHDHYVYNEDAWWMEFVKQRWRPKVYNGDPYYKQAYANDNANSKQIFYTSDYVGELLSNYYEISLSMGRARAIDNSEGSPTSNLLLITDWSGYTAEEYHQITQFELYY
jgi:hypothetical protein